MVLGLAMLPACESLFGIDEPTLREPPKIAGEVAKKLAHARCGALKTCLGHLYSSLVAERYNAGFRDEPCEEVMEDMLLARELVELDASIAAGRVKYEPLNMDACAEALVAQGCSLDLVDRPNFCSLALQGQRHIGDDCRSNAECEDEAFCDMSATCPGVCKARRGAGQPCTDPVVLAPRTSRECEVGLMCDGFVCQSVPGEGQPCELALSRPLCTTGTMCLNQVCVSILGVATTAEGGQCFGFVGPLCAEGLGCEFTQLLLSGTCRVSYDAGSDCCESFPERCPSGSRCEGGTCGDGQTGICKALPAVGEPCLGGVCRPFSRCVVGSCEKLAQVGEDCVDASICYSGRCIDGKCATPCAE
jgi:hypothetical protein